MKALLVAVNSQYVHSSLAVWYLKAAANNEPLVFETTINRDLLESAKEIIALKPDLLCFSCYIWNISYIKQLVNIIKNDLPKVKILLGGPEVSYCAAKVLEELPKVDFICVGQGEVPFAWLYNALKKGESGDGIDGIYTRSFATEPFLTEELPESPYCKEYFDTLNGRITYIESSRGCPYRCAFCLSGRCGGVQFFPLERTKKEMLLLANSGSTTIKFVDRTFNANKQRAKEIFAFIGEHYGKEIPEGVCFHFEIAGDILDNSILEVLRTLPKGAVQFEIGLQSFNEQTLKAVNRKTDINKLCENIKKIMEMGNIHLHIDLIAGLPYEDLESFKNSFNTAFQLKPHHLQFGFLKLLHGADMREKAEEYPCNFNEQPPYEVVSTPWLAENELKQLKRTEQIFDRMHNSGRFRRAEEYLLNTLNIKPFDFFLELAEVKGEYKTPDELCALLLDHFGDRVDRMRLRDCMVCDRLATNRNSRLPKVLKVEDKEFKKIKAEYKNNSTNVALIYTDKTVVLADLDSKDPVTGEYVLRRKKSGGNL